MVLPDHFPVFLTLLITTFFVVSSGAKPSQKCRYIPGDAGWPSSRVWQELNRTVSGRLIATTPLGKVCHTQGQFAAYDEAACAALKDGIVQRGQQTFESQPGDPMNPYFETLSCSPFTAANSTCELGDRAAYSIAVRTAADAQAGIKFAKENNLRLVIRSTGIDYMGKSTGKGALELWMWNRNTTEIIPSYTSHSYSGPAIKLGPGVIAGEAYTAAAAAGYRFVGPECGLVSVAGGYTQGGGHSQLSSAYGLAADQVLEWEVVTAKGEHLVATPEHNPDLYWALSGGGGGTYGVVLSLTAKAYKERAVAGGTLLFANTNETVYWEAMRTWFSLTPSFVNGTSNKLNNVQFAITKDVFLGFSLTLPDQNASAVAALVAPFLTELTRLAIPYNLTTFDSPSYVEHYIKSYGPLPYGSLCPLYVSLGSRLIPRATVLDTSSTTNLMSVYKSILATGDFTIGCSILNVDDAHIPSHAPNAVHPAWRSAIAYCNPQSAWDWDEPAKSLEAKRALVQTHYPALEAATPGSGVYLNEVDPWYEGDWKGSMYGVNYDRLLGVKHKYDPERLMYTHFGVGADEFRFDRQGRLCFGA